MKMTISEFSIIDRYFSMQGLNRLDVSLGIGDDCALLLPPPGKEMVVTIDTLIDNVHFFSTTEPKNIGYKALAVNLSDLAAMGAIPTWFTLALTLPNISEEWLERFSSGLFELANLYGIQLVGGDTTHGSINIITVQAHGFVPMGQALRRDGARPGDRIYVTGTIGDAGLGLLAAYGRIVVSTEHCFYTKKRLERPEPRIAQGLDLIGIASAAIDLSDGLAQDLNHIIRRSRVGALLDVDLLPLSTALTDSMDRDAALITALTSGDDYELCFTVPLEGVVKIEDISDTWDCKCTCIGMITSDTELRLIRADGSLFNLERLGYDHFN
jgi:thiamine-monophosphate kinase